MVMATADSVRSAEEYARNRVQAVLLKSYRAVGQGPPRRVKHAWASATKSSLNAVAVAEVQIRRGSTVQFCH